MEPHVDEAKTFSRNCATLCHHLKNVGNMYTHADHIVSSCFFGLYFEY